MRGMIVLLLSSLSLLTLAKVSASTELAQAPAPGPSSASAPAQAPAPGTTFSPVPQDPISYLPVIPGGRGFGMSTRAGRGGAVYRVTNTNSRGAGSFRACAEASGPRVCIFEVSGYIDISPELRIYNPYLTIAGQTAPSPGITLRGGKLIIATSDVLVQHIRVRVGDGPGSDPDDRDALTIDGYKRSPSNPVENVVVDHCSFSWSIDEVVSAWWYTDQITLSNNIIAQPLHRSLHPKGPHGFGVIFGHAPGSISMLYNIMAHNTDRSPNSRAEHFAMLNNTVYNWTWYATRLTGEEDLGIAPPATNSSVIGNMYIPGPDTIFERLPIEVLNPNSATKVYVSDNAGFRQSGDPMSMVEWSSGLEERQASYSAPSGTILEGIVAASPGQAHDFVLVHAGARPKDRDSVDIGVINEIKSRAGTTINCVSADGSERCQKNAGGWPSMPMNRITHTLPANPSGDDDGNGYTNLEEWLHQKAAALE
ncbi:hypothetical protein JQ634_14850 [Bradyrhizobium sp. AUGA SZCCT0240]|uniref:hypothetical protein n=1 Tax=Bradyrhizobium sp. AUGA SZCCT0240 TaxID=2807669 RepID=UPI001BA79CB6|nr:hypothetical protein [Bradyrhizobium sp. AUGA SZCCT0240]MBR1254975.1 hypothetical protein [Bradyrhizobium sp. AUGA SZCCT0240]